MTLALRNTDLLIYDKRWCRHASQLPTVTNYFTIEFTKHSVCASVPSNFIGDRFQILDIGIVSKCKWFHNKFNNFSFRIIRNYKNLDNCLSFYDSDGMNVSSESDKFAEVNCELGQL